MKRLIFVFVLIVFSVLHLNAFQIEADSLKVKKFNITPVPIVFFSPETNWSFGVATLMQLRLKNQSTNNNSSQIYVGAAYTLNKQILFYAPFQLFWNNDKNYSFGEVGYYKYFFQFYGIGINAKYEDEEIFDVNFPRIDINYTYKIKPKLYIGPGLYYENFKITGIESGGIIDTNDIVGKEGGNIVGLQFNAILDHRDNIYFPKSGYKLTLKSGVFSSIIGSDYNFTMSDFDFSKYFSIKNSVLAANIGGVFSTNNVPLHLLAQIGGTKRLRGYLKGRYRDKHFIFSQLEYRSPEIWRIRLVAFAGTGSINSKLCELNVDNFRTTYGAGMRLRLNKENVNLRIDYGFNQETSGFYFTVGEAF